MYARYDTRYENVQQRVYTDQSRHAWCARRAAVRRAQAHLVGYLASGQDRVFYGTNLNDKRVVAKEAVTFSYIQTFFNRPRTVGIQIEKKF